MSGEKPTKKERLNEASGDPGKKRIIFGRARERKGETNDWQFQGFPHESGSIKGNMAKKRKTLK